MIRMLTPSDLLLVSLALLVVIVVLAQLGRPRPAQRSGYDEGSGGGATARPVLMTGRAVAGPRVTLHTDALASALLCGRA
jgi:hypothetical protein